MSCEQENNTVNNKFVNTSGRGDQYPVPDIVANRFNWGAFAFNWIWGVVNNTKITLIIFVFILISWIPIINLLSVLIMLGLCIWFGIKGNTWAWQNKRYENVTAFHEDQERWAIAAAIQFGVFGTLAFIGIVLALILPTLLTNTNSLYNSSVEKKSLQTLKEVVMMNEALEEKCELSSNGLAECFEKRIYGKIDGNVLEALDGTVWTFNGNGICKRNGDCNVSVKSSAKHSAKEVLNIPLYVNKKGYIYLKEEDILKDY